VEKEKDEDTLPAKLQFSSVQCVDLASMLLPSTAPGRTEGGDVEVYYFEEGDDYERSENDEDM